MTGQPHELDRHRRHAAPRATAGLTDWLGEHTVLRSQLALIARAAGDVTISETARVAALEEHLGLMTRLLVRHDQHEDRVVWPTLRSADPRLDELLDELEQDHLGLEDLAAVGTDTRTPLPRRAPVLRDLHRELAAHLDREEAEVVPAVRRLLPAGIPASHDASVHEDLGAGRAETLVWRLGGLTAAERTVQLARLPLSTRLLYRAWWRPRHRRHVRLLYGADVARSA